MISSTAQPVSHQVVAKSWPEFRGRRLLGCLQQLRTAPLEMYDAVWREHGDFVRLRALPGFYFYLIAHPDGIDHVLHSQQKNFRKPDVFNRSAALLAGQGILTSEGEIWRRQRRLIQPAFLRQQVATLSSHMVAAIDLFIREWEEQGDGRTFDVVPEMMRLALRIAGMALFSTDISGDADSIGQAFRTAFEFVSSTMNGRLTPLWVPTHKNREFRQSKALLDGVVLQLIAERRRAPAKNDVLGLLLAAADEESGARMTDRQLKDEAITLLTAGHETSGAALSWAWYLLVKHPGAQQALHDQVSAHLGGRLPTADDLASMPLATAVFEETMRLYPPAWGMPRESIQADNICGYPLPAKATLVLSQHLIHRHPAFWQEPDKFDPGRFLPPQNADRPKFAYFPFGGGPRVCVGNHFAMVEGPLVLAALAQRFQFALVPDQAVVPDPTFTLRPKYGVQVVVRKRS